MEDISRELEKEIERSKPKPYKQDRKTKMLIVDDFGKMRSGDHFRKLVKVFLVIAAVSLLSAIILSILYAGLLKDSVKVKSDLALAQKTVKELTGEKEMLMAKLVISGRSGELASVESPADKKSQIRTKTEPVKDSASPPALEANKAEGEPRESIPAPDTASGAKKQIREIKPIQEIKVAPGPVIAENETDTQELEDDIIGENVNKTVGIEEFEVTKDRSGKDILIRFNIRKITEEPGDVSGRIFVILKPEGLSKERWLVIPACELKDGLPADYTKGQYFSIARFKPVKFRAKNQADPYNFKKASIYVYNDKEELIFKKTIDISEAQ